MLLPIHIIVTYIKENIITKLQKLYNPPRNPRVGSKSSALFVKKPLCMGDLLPACKILKGLYLLAVRTGNVMSYFVFALTGQYKQYIFWYIQYTYEIIIFFG